MLKINIQLGIRPALYAVGLDRMDKFEEKKGGESGQFETHHFVERPSLGEFFEPQGAFDGRLLFKNEKITFIFLEVTDVVSIHFDKSRREIFYKGHHVDNVELSEVEWMHLEKFRQAIQSNAKASENYSVDFEEALKDLIQRKS